MKALSKYRDRINKWRLFRNLHSTVGMIAIEINGGNMLAFKKGDLAIIKHVPKPESGYRYLDVVRIGKQVGTSKVRDDEILVYSCKEKVFESKIPTYQFEAVIVTPRDYFNLTDKFNATIGSISIPFPFNDPEYDWKQGYFASIDLEKVKTIFDNFVKDNQSRQIKNITQIAG